MTIDRDVTSALSLELIHRGKERLITTAYRFFGLERPYIGGVGREAAPSSELVDQVEVLRRRYHESVAQLASLPVHGRAAVRLDLRA